MRRAAASVLVTVGLLAASVAWWSFAARFTVLDPARSARIAEAVIDQPVVRDGVAEGLSTALRQALPPGTPISPEEMDALARRALDDPRAVEALRAAVLSSHRRLVGDDDGPVTLDVSPIAAAGRDALLSARPELAGALPEAPSLSVDLPTERLPQLGWLPERIRVLSGLAALLAVTLLSLGLATTSDRPRVVSRGGRWALRAGLAWAALGWALPYALTTVDHPALAALGAIAVAAAGPMITPAVTLVVAGAGALAGARAWRLALAARTPAPPSGGPGPSLPPSERPDPAGRGSSRPGSWDRRPPVHPPGERVPTPAGSRANPFARPRRPAEGSTRTWWA